MTDEETRVEVVLLKPHNHRGIDLPPGTKIELRQSQADRLAEVGVCQVGSVIRPGSTKQEGSDPVKGQQPDETQEGRDEVAEAESGAGTDTAPEETP